MKNIQNNQNSIPSPAKLQNQFVNLGFNYMYNDGDLVCLEHEKVSFMYINYANEGKDKSQYHVYHGSNLSFEEEMAIEDKAFEVGREVRDSYADKKEGTLAGIKARNEILAQINSKKQYSSLEDLMIALAQIVK